MNKKCENCRFAYKACNEDYVYCIYWQNQCSKGNLELDEFIKNVILKDNLEISSVAVGWGYPNKSLNEETHWSMKGTSTEGLMYNDQICIPKEDCCSYYAPYEGQDKKIKLDNPYISGLNIDISDTSNWVAIIGSRKASEREYLAAYTIAKWYAEKGKIVVSGLAKNIDTAAHKGAIAGGGKTIAIVNTSKQEPIYPKENKELAEAIKQKGCIIHPFITAADNSTINGLNQFQRRLIERDHIVGRLCPIIVAVQDSNSPIDGGTRWAVSVGKEYGNKIFRMDANCKFYANPITSNAKREWPLELSMHDIEMLRIK